MTILVVGASGATGRLLVGELLDRGQRVRAIVRTPERLPAALAAHPLLSVVQASVLDLDDDALAQQVEGCSGVASCLGHNLSLRGIYGSPRRLVAHATRRLCQAVRERRPHRPVRFVLMNTAGNRNLAEPVSLGQRCIVGLVRLLLPPHRDNELAAAYLRDHLGPNEDAIEWAVVRPDSLVDEGAVSSYEVHPAPTRSAIFNPGKSSRINVAHFMADLLMEEEPWSQWRGRMPVIYNHGFA
ncbi:NAD(P)-binding oxidoreductase [Pseudomonas sp. CAU 1711]|uniref:NAD(P)-dependent oxidoreductase n=1 Tax=Pseudomonas sp. CAU 1711 TaxID=3140356 RepID=UPI0032615C23